MKFSVFQVSRKGGREKNEDRKGYCYTRGAAVFLLADGMGGHPDGEVAAQLALQTVTALFQREAAPELADVSTFVSQAVFAAHRQILRYATNRAMLDSPRTTIVLAVFQDGSLTWTHCGDSRLYLVRDSQLLVRSKDHSLLEQNLSRAGSAAHPHTPNRNVLFTCLGSPTKPVFNVIGPMPLQQGDRIMLCSDGLWSNLSDEDIVFELSQKAVEDSVPDMVEKALRAGGGSCDNVSCIAMEWETPDSFDSTRIGVSTDSISDGVFASTVQAAWFNDNIEDMDDASIERSIAEINEAIRRSAEKKP